MKMTIIEKVAIGIIGAIFIAAVIIGAMTVNGYIDFVGEVNADFERVREEMLLNDIEHYYGEDARDRYVEIDNEWTEDGHGGIGTYEFEYWGETLRLNAVSADKNQRVFTTVECNCR